MTTASSTYDRNESRMTIPTDEARGAYWDQYYSKLTDTARPLPSQFAVFVASELQTPHRVVEFGCGNGRDSLFFSSNGHRVIGVDASDPAINRCVRLAETLGETADFLTSSIDDRDLVGKIGTSEGPTAIYARFFLHAVTEEEEQSFFRCANTLTEGGDIMAVEYRTVRDLSQAKTTVSHYRRFIDPVVFMLAAVDHGFHVRYAVEGFGYAKYMQDDAYVARCILVRG
jgi:cyclopropane fatty-acyl-phospholipid synthase-like methyltransferase